MTLVSRDPANLLPLLLSFSRHYLKGSIWIICFEHSYLLHFLIYQNKLLLKSCFEQPTISLNLMLISKNTDARIVQNHFRWQYFIAKVCGSLVYISYQFLQYVILFLSVHRITEQLDKLYNTDTLLTLVNCLQSTYLGT